MDQGTLRVSEVGFNTDFIHLLPSCRGLRIIVESGPKQSFSITKLHGQEDASAVSIQTSPIDLGDSYTWNPSSPGIYSIQSNIYSHLKATVSIPSTTPFLEGSSAAHATISFPLSAPYDSTVAHPHPSIGYRNAASRDDSSTTTSPHERPSLQYQSQTQYQHSQPVLSFTRRRRRPKLSAFSSSESRHSSAGDVQQSFQDNSDDEYDDGRHGYDLGDGDDASTDGDDHQDQEHQRDFVDEYVDTYPAPATMRPLYDLLSTMSTVHSDLADSDHHEDDESLDATSIEMQGFDYDQTSRDEDDDGQGQDEEDIPGSCSSGGGGGGGRYYLDLHHDPRRVAAEIDFDITCHSDENEDDGNEDLPFLPLLAHANSINAAISKIAGGRHGDRCTTPDKVDSHTPPLTISKGTQFIEPAVSVETRNHPIGQRRPPATAHEHSAWDMISKMATHSKGGRALDEQQLFLLQHHSDVGTGGHHGGDVAVCAQIDSSMVETPASLSHACRCGATFRCIGNLKRCMESHTKVIGGHASRIKRRAPLASEAEVAAFWDGLDEENRRNILSPVFGKDYAMDENRKIARCMSSMESSSESREPGLVTDAITNMSAHEMPVHRVHPIDKKSKFKKAVPLHAMSKEVTCNDIFSAVHHFLDCTLERNETLPMNLSGKALVDSLQLCSEYTFLYGRLSEDTYAELSRQSRTHALAPGYHGIGIEAAGGISHKEDFQVAVDLKESLQVCWMLMETVGRGVLQAYTQERERVSDEMMSLLLVEEENMPTTKKGKGQEMTASEKAKKSKKKKKIRGKNKAMTARRPVWMADSSDEEGALTRSIQDGEGGGGGFEGKEQVVAEQNEKEKGNGEGEFQWSIQIEQETRNEGIVVSDASNQDTDGNGDVVATKEEGAEIEGAEEAKKENTIIMTPAATAGGDGDDDTVDASSKQASYNTPSIHPGGDSRSTPRAAAADDDGGGGGGGAKSAANRKLHVFNASAPIFTSQRTTQQKYLHPLSTSHQHSFSPSSTSSAVPAEARGHPHRQRRHQTIHKRGKEKTGRVTSQSTAEEKAEPSALHFPPNASTSNTTTSALPSDDNASVPANATAPAPGPAHKGMSAAVGTVHHPKNTKQQQKHPRQQLIPAYTGDAADTARHISADSEPQHVDAPQSLPAATAAVAAAVAAAQRAVRSQPRHPPLLASVAAAPTQGIGGIPPPPAVVQFNPSSCITTDATAVQYRGDVHTSNTTVHRHHSSSCIAKDLSDLSLAGNKNNEDSAAFHPIVPGRDVPAKAPARQQLTEDQENFVSLLQSSTKNVRQGAPRVWASRYCLADGIEEDSTEASTNDGNKKAASGAVETAAVPLHRAPSLTRPSRTSTSPTTSQPAAGGAVDEAGPVSSSSSCPAGQATEDPEPPAERAAAKAEGASMVINPMPVYPLPHHAVHDMRSSDASTVPPFFVYPHSQFQYNPQQHAVYYPYYPYYPYQQPMYPPYSSPHAAPLPAKAIYTTPSMEKSDEEARSVKGEDDEGGSVAPVPKGGSEKEQRHGAAPAIGLEHLQGKEDAPAKEARVVARGDSSRHSSNSNGSCGSAITGLYKKPTVIAINDREEHGAAYYPAAPTAVHPGWSMPPMPIPDYLAQQQQQQQQQQPSSLAEYSLPQVHPVSTTQPRRQQQQHTQHPTHAMQYQPQSYMYFAPIHEYSDDYPHIPHMHRHQQQHTAQYGNAPQQYDARYQRYSHGDVPKASRSFSRSSRGEGRGGRRPLVPGARYNTRPTRSYDYHHRHHTEQPRPQAQHPPKQQYQNQYSPSQEAYHHGSCTGHQDQQEQHVSQHKVPSKNHKQSRVISIPRSELSSASPSPSAPSLSCPSDRDEGDSQHRSGMFHFQYEAFPPLSSPSASDAREKTMESWSDDGTSHKKERGMQQGEEGHVHQEVQKDDRSLSKQQHHKSNTWYRTTNQRRK